MNSPYLHILVCRHPWDLSAKTGIYAQPCFNNPAKFRLLYSVNSRMRFWCRSWETDPVISSTMNGYDGSIEISRYTKAIWKHARLKLETNYRGNKEEISGWTGMYGVTYVWLIKITNIWKDKMRMWQANSLPDVTNEAANLRIILKQEEPRKICGKY